MPTYTERFIPSNLFTPLKESRKLKMTVISASDLPYHHHRYRPNLRRMRVYAEVSLNVNGVSETTVETKLDIVGESNPRWDLEVDFTIARVDHIMVKLFRERSIVGYKPIGEVKICVENLLGRGINSGDAVSYHVEGTDNGVLNISYSFGDKSWIPN